MQRLQNQQPIQVQSPHGATAISQNAVYFVLGNAFLAELPQHVPTALQDSKLVFTPPADTGESCNGVDHPITNESITKYKNKIGEPLLQDVWMKAIYVELGRLAKGYGDTKGANTIIFVSLDEIPNIPAHQTVTYARIVVDH